MEDIHTAPYKIDASILENLPVLLRILLNGAYALRGLKRSVARERGHLLTPLLIPSVAFAPCGCSAEG